MHASIRISILLFQICCCRDNSLIVPIVNQLFNNQIVAIDYDHIYL